MIRANSSRPPMTLPIRIHSEMGIALPFNTSSTVYQGEERHLSQNHLELIQNPKKCNGGVLLTSLQAVSAPRVMRLVSWAVRRYAPMILADLYLAFKWRQMSKLKLGTNAVEHWPKIEHLKSAEGSITFRKKSSWTLRLTRMITLCPFGTCLTSHTTSVHHDRLQFWADGRMKNLLWSTLELSSAL